MLSKIHQPSAILFQEFDRSLFLAKDARTVNFGRIRENSRTLLDYFEAHGGRPCGASENPAGYMLEIVGAGASDRSAQDWPNVWNKSQESRDVQTELDRIHQEKANEEVAGGESKEAQQEFSMPFLAQLHDVTIRVFQQQVFCFCPSAARFLILASRYWRPGVTFGARYVQYKNVVHEHYHH